MAELQMQQVTFNLAPGRVVLLAVPVDLTDNELLLVIREMSGNLRVAERANQVAAQRPQLVRASAVPAGLKI